VHSLLTRFYSATPSAAYQNKITAADTIRVLPVVPNLNFFCNLAFQLDFYDNLVQFLCTIKLGDQAPPRGPPGSDPSSSALDGPILISGAGGEQKIKAQMARVEFMMFFEWLARLV